MDQYTKEIGALMKQVEVSLEELVGLNESLKRFIRQENLEEKFNIFLQREENPMSPHDRDYVTKEEQERLNQIIEEYQKYKGVDLENETYVSEKEMIYNTESDLIRRFSTAARVQIERQKGIENFLDKYERAYQVKFDEKPRYLLKEYAAYEPDFKKVISLAMDLLVKEDVEPDLLDKIESEIKFNKYTIFDTFDYHTPIHKKELIMR